MNNNTTTCWLIIPAAGSGSRMQLQQAKQYLPLLGKPMLSHTLEAFVDCDFIKGITVALARHDSQFQALSLSGHPKVHSCIGGATRAESVLAGLASLNNANDNDWVMVHDAARPCVTSLQLQQLYDALKTSQHGGFWAIPVADTLKRVAENCPLQTVDRKNIVRAQTPQMFRLGELREALLSALASNIDITDEASALEFASIPAIVVEGHGSNIKVTYPDDASLAEFYLHKLQEQS